MPQHDTRLIGGAYQLDKIILRSGIVTNYTAHPQNTNDVVGLSVIEIPPTEPLETIPALLKRFEIRRQANSSHVLQVHHWGVDGTRLYIATDMPQGTTLQNILDHERVIDISRSFSLSYQIAVGLQVLHAQGITGNDLRPSLITVTTPHNTDHIKISDIGIRPLLQSLHYISMEQPDDIGYVDPRFAPPEYLNKGTIGPWSDIYQLGILLFMCVTGRVPFAGSTPAQTALMQSTAPIPQIRQYNPVLPEALQLLLDHMLAKETQKRYATADEFLDALQALYTPSQSTSRPAVIKASTPPPPMKKEMQHHPAKPDITPAKEQDIAEMMTIIKTLDNSLPDAHESARQIAEKPQAPLSNTPAQTIPNTQGIYAYLGCQTPDGKIKKIAIRRNSIIIGRRDPKRNVSPDVDLTQFDAQMKVSRQHARIYFDEPHFYIEDLKSRNKTKLGRKTLEPLSAEILEDGAELSFGTVRVHFEYPEG
ncbi:MAG TPA: FHA domain-containing serine/threonine-protein kinase [Dictyobacter sp.]|jgi:serine/threonine protein kinase|nr:FHA domain-containing serine/threonine-protein kinase [Dictyobacter sp.]